MNKEKKTKEVSVESFNLPSGKRAPNMDCKFEDEAGARGFCKNCGRSFHNHTVKLPAFGIRKVKWGGV